jgi:signal transduction histidine kinase
MTAATSSRFNPVNAGNVAAITVITVAYAATYVAYFADLNSTDGPPFSGRALAVATALGVVYLVLTLFGYDILRPITGQQTVPATIFLLVILLLAIEFLVVGANAIWLISMPLIATATTDLRAGPRILVYAAALAGVALSSYLRFGDWEFTFFTTLTFITAFVFVVAFVRLIQAAEQARQEAEELTAQLADANRRLGEYAVQAEEMATIQERNRLAREIHDNLGHYLTVVNVQIKAAQALIDKDPARAGAALDKAGQLTQEGLAAVRGSVSALRESPLGRHTLPEAVAVLAAETQAAGIVAELRVEGLARPLDPRVELTLYRAAQEGLTNVRKHARASRVDLLLDYRDPTAVSLTIHDNGLGLAATDRPPGFGLLGLEERARQLGGRVAVATAPGAGYRLTLELPAHDPAMIAQATAEGAAEAEGTGP